MSSCYKNLKFAINKLKSKQTLAENQLLFKEKEALILTGVFISIPLIAITIAMISIVI